MNNFICFLVLLGALLAVFALEPVQSKRHTGKKPGNETGSLDLEVIYQEQYQCFLIEGISNVKCDSKPCTIKCNFAPDVIDTNKKRHLSACSFRNEICKDPKVKFCALMEKSMNQFDIRCYSNTHEITKAPSSRRYQEEEQEEEQEEGEDL